MEKPVETAWVGPRVGWGWASGNDQGGAKSVSQVDGVSDMVHACQFCDPVEGGFRKGSVASGSISVWEKAAPQLSP